MAEAPRTLSDREIDVLRLLAKGATNQQIADELVISVNTVKVHVRNILDKLGAQSRTEATVAAIRSGLVSVPASALDEATRVALVGEVAPPLVETPPVPTTPETPPPVENGFAPAPTPAVAPTRRSAVSRLAPWLGALLALALVVGAFALGNTQAASRPAPTVEAPPVDGVVITSAGQRWSDLASMPTARSGLAAVAQGESIYAIGGQTASGASNRIERYTVSDNSWTLRSVKPTAVRDISAAVLGGKIYTPGGCDGDGHPLAVVEVYTPATDRWTTAPSLPRPLCAYALATLEGKLYLFGGWDGTEYRAETLIYTPGALEWEVGPPMPTARAYAGAAALDDVIYVAGGTNGAALATVEVFDPAGVAAGSGWKTVAPMPQPRQAAGVAALGRRLYVLGGGQADGGMIRYDATADSWQSEPVEFQQEWRGLALVAMHPRLHALGGVGPLDVHRAYRAVYEIPIFLGRPTSAP